MGILLTVSYDGTNYCGWQVQKNGVTVCGILEAAVARILGGQPFSILGASRTDSGVHALGQRAHIISKSAAVIPVARLPFVINSILPNDIAVTHAATVPDSFHPISDAKSKTYVYKIYNNIYRNPLLMRDSVFVRKPLDTKAMVEACKHFVGEHDFAGFCATGGVVKSTVREIYFFDIKKNGNVIEIYVNGNGFLYNMVRIIAGTLVDVGLGKVKPEQIPEIITSGKRIRAGKTMPPQGLTLLEIFY
ncbi:MAG: tRNA pseudouridine(38-40) synthase TruA [Defluviitaleaceae bacterium]|nr:tRNA pseudouridine(38-40) synthase TruA [Defluviitaleaceae bacterium]